MDGTADAEPRGDIWFIVIFVLVAFGASIKYFEYRNPEILTGLPSVKPTVSRLARTYTVFYKSGVFSPTNIRIHVGDTVKFQNEGGSEIRLVFNNPLRTPDMPGFDNDSSIIPAGVFAMTFSRTGIFSYHNGLAPHEEGTVTVRPRKTAMRNRLALRAESLLGSFFVLIFSLLMYYFLYLAVKNFENETEILSSSGSWLKITSPYEKQRINSWLEGNKIIIPSDRNKYRFLNDKFPDRPWLSE